MTLKAEAAYCALAWLGPLLRGLRCPLASRAAAAMPRHPRPAVKDASGGARSSGGSTGRPVGTVTGAGTPHLAGRRGRVKSEVRRRWRAIQRSHPFFPCLLGCLTLNSKLSSSCFCARMACLSCPSRKSGREQSKTKPVFPRIRLLRLFWHLLMSRAKCNNERKTARCCGSRDLSGKRTSTGNYLDQPCGESKSK